MGGLIFKGPAKLFQNGFVILHSFQQCMRGPVLPNHTSTWNSQCFSFKHPNRCTVVPHGGLICVSLMATDVEGLSMLLCVFCLSFFLCLPKTFLQFLPHRLIFLSFERSLYIFQPFTKYVNYFITAFA